jgi:hypothetical protein
MSYEILGALAKNCLRQGTEYRCCDAVGGLKTNEQGMGCAITIFHIQLSPVARSQKRRQSLFNS